MPIARKHLIRPETIDRIFKILTLAGVLPAMLLILGFFVQLSCNAWPAFHEFGLGFIFSTEWDPVMNSYGALPAITGTLITTLIALVIAVPLSFVTALFLVEARGWIGELLSYGVDLLAAIPSIIYGLWGLFFLVPFMQIHVQPHLEWIPFMGRNYNGFGFATAGFILAVMILPFICAIMRDVFRMTPPMLKEAAYGCGTTRWETTVDVTMRYGARGLLGGVFLGLGRAAGETMAVLFVIGNTPEIPKALFDSGTTISATLASNFAEANGVFRNVLFALGLILLLMSLGIQILAQWWLNYSTRKVEGAK